MPTEHLLEKMRLLLQQFDCCISQYDCYACYANARCMRCLPTYTILRLRAYAHDTQHEKIIRACVSFSERASLADLFLEVGRFVEALALAMMMFRKEEEAEPLIQHRA